MDTTLPNAGASRVGRALYACIAMTPSLGGCGTDDGDAAAGTDTDDGSDHSGTATTAVDAASDAGSDGSIDPTAAAVVATGIIIDALEANQGIGFELARDLVPLPPDERPERYVRGRPMLVRAGFTVDDDWEPRAIRAELTATRLEDEPITSTSVVWVDGASADHRLDTSFRWELPGSMVAPGLALSVALFETSADAEGDTTPAPFPEDGPIAVVVGDTAPTLHVVVVPIDYAVGRCETSAGITVDEVPALRDGLFQVLPVADVEVSLHEPIVWTESFAEWQPLNLALSELREAEDAPPWVFYYGVLGRPCGLPGGGNFGEALAQLDAEPRLNEAALRVAAGYMSFHGQLELAIAECVTGLGVLLGRGRSGCPARPASEYPDAGAPNGGALVGWGYGLLDRTLRPPDVTWDSMNECHPRWVTRHGWNRLASSIEAIHQWEVDDAGR